MTNNEIMKHVNDLLDAAHRKILARAETSSDPNVKAAHAEYKVLHAMHARLVEEIKKENGHPAGK